MLAESLPRNRFLGSLTPFHFVYHNIHSCNERSSWQGRYTTPVASLYPICTLWASLHRRYSVVMVERWQVGAEHCLGGWGKDDRKQNKFVPLHRSVVGLIVGCICRWLYGCCWFVTIMYISCIMPVILHRYCTVCAVNEHIIIISIHNSLRCCLPYVSNCEWYVYWALCVLYSMYYILYFIFYRWFTVYALTAKLCLVSSIYIAICKIFYRQVQ